MSKELFFKVRHNSELVIDSSLNLVALCDHSFKQDLLDRKAQLVDCNIRSRKSTNLVLEDPELGTLPGRQAYVCTEMHRFVTGRMFLIASSCKLDQWSRLAKQALERGTVDPVRTV